MAGSALITGGTGGLGAAVTRVFLDGGWRVVVPLHDDAAPLRALVNLVGGFAMGERLHETPVEDFEDQLRLNLRPTYLACQAALPDLQAAGGGASVCVSSRSAL